MNVVAGRMKGVVTFHPINADNVQNQSYFTIRWYRHVLRVNSYFILRRRISTIIFNTVMPLSRFIVYFLLVVDRYCI